MTSDQLVAVFEGLGCADVATFLASGNVLFDGDLDPDAAAGALQSALGYAVPTTIRSGPELVAIAELEPFKAADVEASTGKPQVMLLFNEPSPKDRNQALAMAEPENLLVFGNRELHWLPSTGMSESTLDLKRIADLVGTNTVRTANTIARLAGKL